MVSTTESNTLAKQLPIGYQIQNYTIKAYLNQSYFANIYLVEAPSGEQQQVKQFVLKEYFPYFANRQTDFSLDAGDYQEHLLWGKAHALKKAQFLAQINSPHIAMIRSYFEANNTVYLLRDYYQGMTLAEWLRQMRLEHLVQKLDLSPDAISEAMLSEVRLSSENTEKLLYPVIEALGFMHSYRASEFAYSHENISPDNIFLTSSADNSTTSTNSTGNGTAKSGLASLRAVLFDGIGAGAKINPDLLAPGYTPPEAYGQYDAYKPSGDVYSLAATMYSLLTGNVPAHAQERLTVKDNLDLDLTSIEPDLDLKLSKALNIDPTKRYGSALSFLQALQSPQLDISEASDIRDAISVPPVNATEQAGIKTAGINQAATKHNPTAFIEVSDTMETSVDPALKATEVGNILWSDPSEDMLPITFGDYAGTTPQYTVEKNMQAAATSNNGTTNNNGTSEVVLNHPAFFQIDGQANSANTNQATAALNNHSFEQPVFEEAGVYNYSESVEITAPESFLTQERQIGAEEAKTTLFSVHPMHPVHPLQAEQQVPTDAHTISEQQVLHHAELLKGSTAFQYIDGQLKNKNTVDNSLALEEDYGKTLIYNTKVADASSQAVFEASALLNNHTQVNNSAQINSNAQVKLEQTGIKGLTQWPISALDNTQTHITRERKPVQKRFPTLADVLKTGFSESDSGQEKIIGIKPQRFVRLIMLITLLTAFGILLFSLRSQTPSTPFQNGTARASASPTQSITQPIEHTSSKPASSNLANPTNLAEGERPQVIPEFVFKQHKQAVRAVAFSPQGNLIASASDDKKIHLWDNQTQALVKTLEPITDSAFIKDIAFSTDYLAAVDTSGMVTLWDVYSGARTKLDLYKHTKALNTVSFSHDAKFLATGSEDGKALIWEFANNRFGQMQMVDLSQKAITSLSFSPEDNSLLVAADASLRVHLWNNKRNNKQTITAWNSMSRLNDVQFSSDGSQLALAGLDKESVGIISVWDVATRQLELTLHHPKFHSEGFAIRPESANSVRAVTADPQGQWWASAGIDGIVHLWSNSGALLQSMPTGQKGIYSLAANPVNQGLVTAAADGSVQTWLIE